MTARSFVRTSANESVYTMNTRVTGVTTCRMLPIGSSPGPFLVLREQTASLAEPGGGLQMIGRRGVSCG